MMLLLAVLGCVSPDALHRELDAKLLRLRPGLSLEDVSREVGVPRELLVLHEGKVLVHLMAVQGARTSFVTATCAVDTQEHLGACNVDLPRVVMQLVTTSQRAGLRKGQGVGFVLAELCEPEAMTALPRGEFELRYSVELPPPAFLPYWPLVLRFGADGRLKDVR